MTAVLATKATTQASANGWEGDEWAIHTQCKALNLQRAKTVDYMAITRDGVIVDVARVYGAEPLPARWNPDSNRVNFIVGAQVPSDIEALIGTPLTWAGKNPNAYYTLEDGELTKA